MARILILESHREIRELFAHVIARMGYEPVTDAPSDPRSAAVDMILLEPANDGHLAQARRLHSAQPDLPIVCASIFPPSGETSELAPVAYLTKPFGLSELERAIEAAVPATV